MEIDKPKFWQNKKSFFSIILLPLTFLVLVAIFLKKKISNQKKFNIPVLCIGNIYIGGTGKTPLSMMIADELKNIGKKPVIIKKFYKNQNDEHLLIKKKTISLISEKSRKNAINLAEKQYDLAILDDGFQDYGIKKDLSILCFHSEQLIGNGFVFPSGPLRENFNSIKRAQIIIINGQENLVFEKKIYNINANIQLFYSNYILNDYEKYKNTNILAIAGIGNPNNFFNLLLENGLKIKKTFAFPDHYEFNKKELSKIIDHAKKNSYTILTTEKDFLRIEKYKLPEINYCSIDLKIKEKEKLISLIKKIYD
jgi:tetraacyldisaccharide 4'-kinase